MSAPLSVPGRRVLIVEDDPPIRQLLHVALSRRSFSCDCLHNGREAIERLSNESYDVILLDLMLPIVSGIDVITYLKETQPESLDRVIIVTAVSNATLEALGDLSRIRTLLRKPFDLAELIEEVEGCAGRLPREIAPPTASPQEPTLLD